MPGFISEFAYFGEPHLEFVEIALPAGTDPSGYSLVFYEGSGYQYDSWSFSQVGSVENTIAGHDVYVLDSSDATWNTSDPSGNFYPNDAIALVDGSGTVVQFISWEGYSITAQDGLAAGHTSTSVGSTGYGESLQSDNGGSSYYTQSSTNAGTIPACYASGTRINTPDGDVPVEDLRPGDLITTANGRAVPVLWVCADEQSWDAASRDDRPILISKNALAPGVPNSDLIVSAQHRIAMGLYGDDACFDAATFVPAKALAALPRIREMHGKSTIRWHHFVCADHSLVLVQGLVSESMCVAPQALRALSVPDRAALVRAIGVPLARRYLQKTVLPCLQVQTAWEQLNSMRFAYQSLGAGAPPSNALPST